MMGVVILLSSCKEPLNFRISGNGNIVSESRNLSFFDEIESSGCFNVFITQDSVSEIIVEAEENLQPYIETKIAGNKLIIKTMRDKNLRNTRPINVYVRSEQIYQVTLSGSGYIKVNDFNSGYLTLDISGSGEIDATGTTTTINANISGSGDILLSGNAGNSDYKISGSGDIRSYNLNQNSCNVNISGSGNCFVFVNDKLDVKISGSGDVNYIGNPSVVANISGSGNVISNN